MRLIDADMLKKYMLNNGKEVERFLGYIDEQPTAYNPDAVAKELRNYAIEFEAFGFCSEYVDLSHAIEIVKRGRIG